MQGPQRFALSTSYSLFMLHTEFPRKPTGVLKDHLTSEADNRLGCYLPLPEPEQPPDPNLLTPAERPKLPEDVVDAPLVRIYNFLRKRSTWSFFRSEKLKSLRNDVNVIPVGDTLVPGIFFRPYNVRTTPIISRHLGRTSSFTRLGGFPEGRDVARSQGVERLLLDVSFLLALFPIFFLRFSGIVASLLHVLPLPAHAFSYPSWAGP